MNLQEKQDRAGRVQLNTERMIIRDFRQEDLDEHHRLMSDPQIMHYLQDIQTHSLEESKEDMEKAMGDIENPERTMYFLRMEEKETGEQIGEIGYTVTAVTPVGTLVHLGYYSFPKFWGRGYMTEAAEAVVDFAFSRSGVYRITTGCLAENKASEQVMKHCGFIKEAEHKEWEWLDGAMKDRLEYRLLRQEWKDKKYGRETN